MIFVENLRGKRGIGFALPASCYVGTFTAHHVRLLAPKETLMQLRDRLGLTACASEPSRIYESSLVLRMLLRLLVHKNAGLVVRDGGLAHATIMKFVNLRPIRPVLRGSVCGM